MDETTITATEECGACGQLFVTLDEVFTHDCPALQQTRWHGMPHTTYRSDNVDAPERHEGGGRGQARDDRATDKQLAFLRKLIAERPTFADVENLHADGPGGRGWSKREASAAIDRLLAQPAEGQSRPAPTVAAAPAHRPNKYAGTCGTCRGHVAAEAGRLDRVDGRWVAYHLEGECPDVEHAAPQPTELADVPAGHYAIESSGHNDLAFYRVDRPTQGSYAGRVFVKLIVGGHPDQNVARSHVAGILARIAADPDAAARYGRELGRCSNCNRTLTDEVSRELGIGPECRKRAA